MCERREVGDAGLDWMLNCAPEPLSRPAVVDVSLFPQFGGGIHMDVEECRPKRFDHEGVILGKPEPVNREIPVGWEVQNETPR